MANEEQLAILKQGVDVWNKWREENQNVGVDLRKADLHGAILTGANLAGADLTWADLSKADMSGVTLFRANASEANLSDARLAHTNLVETQLVRAILRHAELNSADLFEANPSEASLCGAMFGFANLTLANLSRTDFTYATFHWTILGSIDLSTAIGLENVRHLLRSILDIETMYKSQGNIPDVFLRGCGVPEDMIGFVHSLRGKAIEFYTCFISHSTKDKLFVERLHNDLQAKGVRTWYFPEDARWGRSLWGEIDRGIKIYDKLVVVCSRNSLQSEPVVREIDRALQREAKERKEILFPITLDRYVYDEWEHELKADLLRKVIGEFCGWDCDAALYDKAFQRLLGSLQAG